MNSQDPYTSEQEEKTERQPLFSDAHIAFHWSTMNVLDMNH